MLIARKVVSAHVNHVTDDGSNAAPESVVKDAGLTLAEDGDGEPSNYYGCYDFPVTRIWG